MSAYVFYKTSAERKDYSKDWTTELESTEILSVSSWTIDPVTEGDDSLEIDAETTGAKGATVWLTGGTLGNRYILTNRVETTGDRILEDFFTLILEKK